jgi:hypothetical protein
MKHSILIGLLAAMASLAAHATLGGTVDTVEQDRVQFHAQVHTMQRAAFTVHEMSAESGIVVKEYADKQGVVFAVRWSGPWRPDMQQLLGNYFGSFKHDPQSAESHLGRRRPIDVQHDDLVIRSEGHMRAFSGYAYLPQKLPVGVSPSDLQ